MASAAARLLHTYAIQVSFLLRADEVIRGLPRGQAGIAVCPSAEAPPALVNSRGGARVTHGLGAASDGIQANTEILSKSDCFAYEVCDLIVGVCILTTSLKCALIRMVKVATAKKHQSD